MNKIANHITRFSGSIAKLLFSAGALLTLAACDNVATDDRFIEVPAADVQRAVLIEDFTGQNCINCPGAHEVIEQLQEQYGDNVIAVSIHAGSLAVDASRTNYEYDYVGLKQPEGDQYNDHFSIVEWPKGVINRQTISDAESWPTLVRTALEQKAEVDIDLEVVATDGKLVIDTQLRPHTDASANLQLWVVESGIVAFQRSLTGRIADYVHNNVYRASVNGLWGEPVKLESGIHQSLHHTIDIRNLATEVWQPANLAVVAFVYNDSGVLQAVRKVATVE